MSQFDLREKFVNEMIVTRKDVSLLNEERTGNKKLKGHILNSVPNPELNIWVRKVPKVVRAGAIKDYCTGRKAAFENLKRGNILSFNMNYRNYKQEPAFHIEKHVQSISSGKYIKLFPYYILFNYF